MAGYEKRDVLVHTLVSV